MDEIKSEFDWHVRGLKEWILEGAWGADALEDPNLSWRELYQAALNGLNDSEFPPHAGE